MAAFNKFDAFVEALAEQQHNLATDTLKVFLTNDTPNAAGDASYTDITDLSTGGGYTAGGNVATQVSSSQTGGLYKLVLGDPSTWTASGAGFGPFRYAVIYNNTAASKGLIGWWDYGSSISLSAGDTFTVDFDPTTGVLTLQ